MKMAVAVPVNQVIGRAVIEMTVTVDSDALTQFSRSLSD